MFISSFDPFRTMDRATSWMPAPGMPMDAFRQGDEVRIHLDVPGVGPDDLEVTVESNVLTVVAQRSAPRSEGADVLARERRHGAMRRQITLSDSLDGSKVTADLTDGVLTLTIPVAEKSKPRRVEVAIGSGQAAIDAASTESTHVDA